MGYTEISYWKLFAIALYIPIVGVVTICMVESAEQTQITTQLIQKGLIEYRTNSLSGETKLFWISDSTPFSIGQQKENQKEN